MTHDLFVSFAHAFGVKLKEVFIYKFEDGIFSSELTFCDGDRTVVIDSRTSDAIAIAMRTSAPINTPPEILEETGFVMEVQNTEEDTDEHSNAEENDIVVEETDTDLENNDRDHEPRLEQYSIEELERTLKKLIDTEQYEQAAKVSEILRNKKKK